MIFRKFKKGLKWCQLASLLTVMKWREKPLIFKHGEWFLCSYYWLTYGLRNILHLKTYHHISSLLSIWSKLEFSWSGIKANILPTKCPLSSIIGDFQRNKDRSIWLQKNNNLSQVRSQSKWLAEKLFPLKWYQLASFEVLFFRRSSSVRLCLTN